MQTQLPRAPLAGATGTALEVVSSRADVISIARNLILEPAARGALYVTATDLSTWVRLRLDAVVSDASPATVPARMFRDVLLKLSGDEVALETHAAGSRAGMLRITSGHSQFHLNTLPADEFPAAPGIDWDSGIDIPGDVLAPMLRAAAVTVSADEQRPPALRNVLWESTGDTLNVVSTDGYRLTRISHACGELLPAGNFVVSTRCCRVVAAALADEPAVRVVTTATRIGFRGERVEIVSNLVDDAYPAYERIIPQGHERHVEVDRAALRSALERMALLATDDTHRMTCQLEPGILRLVAVTPDVGTVDDRIPALHDGTPFRIAFNADYVRSLLPGLGNCAAARFSFGNPNQPALIEPVATGAPPEGDAAVLLVCMPLQLADAAG